MRPTITAVIFIALFAVISGAIEGAVSPATTEKAAASGKAITVQIDGNIGRGPVSGLFRTGVFLNSLPVGRPMDQTLRDLKFGAVEFSWDFYPELRDCPTHDEFLRRLPSSNLTQWVKAVVADGGEAYIRLMPVPVWLRDGSDGTRRAPKDYAGWGMYVYDIADYFNNRLGLDVRYIVWDEPDGFWKSSKEEYFKLYQYAADAVKRANPRAMVGGPAASGLGGHIKGRSDTAPLTRDFIRFCASNTLPIDMLIWHTFDGLPDERGGQYAREVKRVRAWLRESGYDDKRTLLVDGSWTALENYNSVSANCRDSEFLASFITSSVMAMDSAGIGRQIFFCLFEDWIRPDAVKARSEFMDGMGLMTRNFVPKAGYNAFRLLNMLEGTAVKSVSDDTLLAHYAVRSGDRLYILLSNFIPPPGMIRLAAANELRFRGYGKQDLQKLGMTPEEIRSEPQEMLRRIEKSGIPQADKDLVRAAANGLRLTQSRIREDINVTLKLVGMPFTGAAVVRQYLIDSTHGNNLIFRDKADREMQLSPVLERKIEIKKDFSQTITLKPYATTLIVIEKKR